MPLRAPPTPPALRVVLTQSLYNTSSDTLGALTKLRFGSSRAKTMQAVVYAIDKTLYEILAESEVLTLLEELEEELPDHLPRFVVLSYPTTLPDGRPASPYVLVYFRPPTATQQAKMLYAGALELFKDKAGVAKVLEIEEAEEVAELPARVA